MKKNLNLKSLLQEDFMPLEESKEGMLRGGFAALYTLANNCNCSSLANDCACDGNSCNKDASALNTNCPCGSDDADNCNCQHYASKSSSSVASASSHIMISIGLPCI